MNYELFYKSKYKNTKPKITEKNKLNFFVYSFCKKIKQSNFFIKICENIFIFRFFLTFAASFESNPL
jgi:hypothetical protein